jgi:hypothetical protein
MGERAERGMLRRERSLKRTLRSMEPHGTTNARPREEEGPHTIEMKPLRKTRSMGLKFDRLDPQQQKHDTMEHQLLQQNQAKNEQQTRMVAQQCYYRQHELRPSSSFGNISNSNTFTKTSGGKENLFPPTMRPFGIRTPLPPYSSPAPPEASPVESSLGGKPGRGFGDEAVFGGPWRARTLGHPLSSNPMNFVLSPPSGPSNSEPRAIKQRQSFAALSAIRESNVTEQGIPARDVGALASKTARLRHRASLVLTPLGFRSKKSSPAVLAAPGTVISTSARPSAGSPFDSVLQSFRVGSARKASAGTAASGLSGASRRSRAESLREKLKRYFRKSSGESTGPPSRLEQIGMEAHGRSQDHEQSGKPDQHVEARKGYYTSGTAGSASSPLQPSSPALQPIGLGIGSGKSPSDMSDAGTTQSKSRVTSWADSSVAETVPGHPFGESAAASRLSMIAEDEFSNNPNSPSRLGRASGKRYSSIGSGFLKKILRRSGTGSQENMLQRAQAMGHVEQPSVENRSCLTLASLAAEESAGYSASSTAGRRHSSFAPLTSWRQKMTVRSVTPDVAGIIAEEDGVDNAYVSSLTFLYEALDA